MPLARFGSLADKPSAKIQICSLRPNNEHPGSPPRRHLPAKTQSSDGDGPARLLGLCVSLKTPRFFLATPRQAGTQRH